jgi:hypothetical protein
MNPFDSVYNPRLRYYSSHKNSIVPRRLESVAQDLTHLRTPGQLDLLSSSPSMSATSSDDYLSPDDQDEPPTPPAFRIPLHQESTPGIFSLMTVDSSPPAIEILLPPVRESIVDTVCAQPARDKSHVRVIKVVRICDSMAFNGSDEVDDVQEFPPTRFAALIPNVREQPKPQTTSNDVRLQIRQEDGHREVDELCRQLFQVSRPDVHDVEWLVNNLIGRTSRLDHDGITDVTLSWICGLRTWLKSPHVDGLSWLVMAIRMASYDEIRLHTINLIRSQLKKSDPGLPLPSFHSVGLSEAEMDILRWLREDLDDLVSTDHKLLSLIDSVKRSLLSSRLSKPPETTSAPAPCASVSGKQCTPSTSLSESKSECLRFVCTCSNPTVRIILCISKLSLYELMLTSSRACLRPSWSAITDLHFEPNVRRLGNHP